MNSNLPLNILVLVSYLAWGYLLIINYYFISARILLAWSFDRAAPSILGSVSDRFHSPVLGLIIAGILGWIALFFYSYVSVALAAVNVAFFFLVAQMLDGLGGALLSSRGKSIFEMSPGFIQKRIGGIPVISLLGVYSIAFIVFLFVSLIYNPATLGPSGLPTVLPTAAAFVVGIASYLGMKSYYLKRGMDISMVFKMIPPE
jgi:amino acid transporter